jgi:hypothetical protein
MCSLEDLIDKRPLLELRQLIDSGDNTEIAEIFVSLQFIVNHNVIVGNIVNIKFSPIYTYSYISFSNFSFWVH